MKFIADFHVHTISSGHAYNTIYEYAAHAEKIGLKAIAMTDHGPAMAGAPHLYHFQNLKMIPKYINGVRIFKGVEANIMDEKGTLDLENSTLKELDIVLASFHQNLGYDGKNKAKNTKALLSVIKNPYVNIIAHPGNPQFAVDTDAMLEACMKHCVLIEINNNSFAGFVRVGSYSGCLEIAKKIKKINWKVAFGSDAHCIDQLGIFDSSLKLAKEAGLTEKHIINSSLDLIDKYLLSKRKS